ncbi:type II secretion system protein GspD [Halarcobacter bivalviorum]|uniref:General secretion pathway protein GspD n=1 Tax=Halarcobacter bivalviorum TaxID=663364 RepID=A0AAX2A9Y7_9BACT|nr:secretin N-terminal domain-containing protein [Halarcobacter bivalviorum]AXH11812.1 type II secretion/transformation system, D protein [Halarcobacter bivalviorum]RXK10938.1 general secretion pathway protein GspD [Halarcobacter bivalviorum]
MKAFLIILCLYIFLYSEDKINVNFNNLELIELIKITSKTINKNILVSQEIKGKVNFVSSSPISKEQLLEILKLTLKENGYFLEEKSGILRVKPLSKKVTLSKIKNSSNLLVKTEVVRLLNIEAKELENIISKLVEKRYKKDSFSPIIVYEESSNSIIVSAKKSELSSLVSLIKDLDRRKKQIYVKAKIVELDDSLLNEIGFRFGILKAKAYSSGLHTFSSNLNNGTALTFDTSTIGLEIPNLSSSIALGASLNLLNKTYALDIVSEPSLLCLNNKQSSIYVGETVSIQTGSTTTDGGTTKNVFEREDIGLTLKVKPRVNENRVLLNIEAIIEGIKNNRTNNNPDTSKKQIITTAFVNNGESVILGGLIEKRNEKSIEKVPFASDIPILGELFKNRYKEKRTKNLIIIITPYIVPEKKDLTFVTQELSKIKVFEDKLLEEFLFKLKEKRIDEKKPSLKQEEILKRFTES